MTELEKLLVINSRQTMDLAKAMVGWTGTVKQLAETTEALNQSTTMVRHLKGEIACLRLDLAAAKAGIGEGGA